MTAHLTRSYTSRTGQARPTRSPAFSREPERPLTASARPKNFVQWWDWAVDQASVAKDASPKIHQFERTRHRVPKGYTLHTDRGAMRPIPERRVYDWEKNKYRARLKNEAPSPEWSPTSYRSTELNEEDEHGELGAPVFTRAFENHFEGRLPKSPWRVALGKFHRSRSPIQSPEYRIIESLINGHVDAEAVRMIALSGPRRDYFEAAAIRALEFVWERALDEIAETKEPDRPAGAA